MLLSYRVRRQYWSLCCRSWIPARSGSTATIRSATLTLRPARCLKRTGGSWKPHYWLVWRQPHMRTFLDLNCSCVVHRVLEDAFSADPACCMILLDGHIYRTRLDWHWPLSGQIWAACWDVSMHSYWILFKQP